ELLPHLLDGGLLVAVALDEVADGEDELRLQQVELVDGLRKNLRPVPAGAVADDGKAEDLVVERLGRPRLRPGRVELDFAEGGGGPRGPGDQGRAEEECGKSAVHGGEA